jgi:hypothetical protein
MHSPRDIISHAMLLSAIGRGCNWLAPTSAGVRSPCGNRSFRWSWKNRCEFLWSMLSWRYEPSFNSPAPSSLSSPQNLCAREARYMEVLEMLKSVQRMATVVLAIATLSSWAGGKLIPHPNGFTVTFFSSQMGARESGGRSCHISPLINPGASCTQSCYTTGDSVT